MRYQENPETHKTYQKKKFPWKIPKYKLNIKQQRTKKIQKFVKGIKKLGIRKYQENKKSDNFENFLQQTRQRPYYICTGSLY